MKSQHAFCFQTINKFVDEGATQASQLWSVHTYLTCLTCTLRKWYVYPWKPSTYSVAVRLQNRPRPSFHFLIFPSLEIVLAILDARLSLRIIALHRFPTDSCLPFHTSIQPIDDLFSIVCLWSLTRLIDKLACYLCISRSWY